MPKSSGGSHSETGQSAGPGILPAVSVQSEADLRIANLTRRISDRWGRYLFAALVCILFFTIISPFIVALTMGAVLAILFQPSMRKLQKMRFPTSLAAFLVTTGVTVCVILPTGYILFSGAATGVQEFGNFQKIIFEPVVVVGEQTEASSSFFSALVNKPAVRSVLNSLELIFGIAEQELVEKTTGIIKTIGNKAAELLGEVITSLPSILLSLVVTVVGMFFLLQDGNKLISFMRRYSAMNVHNTERVILTFGTMARSVIMATVLSAAMQTLIFTMAAISLGVSGGATIALAVFVASFFPLVGSMIATLPIASYQLVLGHETAGLVLLLISLLITLLDNIVRPAVLKGSANLHPLLAFVAAIGGIQVLGVAGVFLGPIIAGVFVVTLKILMDPVGKFDRRKRQKPKSRPVKI